MGTIQGGSRSWVACTLVRAFGYETIRHSFLPATVQLHSFFAGNHLEILNFATRDKSRYQKLRIKVEND